MHRIPCPNCGPRDEAEFHYRGDATVSRPDPDAGMDAFYRYVFLRDNPSGWHVEWWHHVEGCRAWIKVVRHMTTHEIAAAGRPEDMLKVPVE